MHFSGDKNYSKIDRKGLSGKSGLVKLYYNVTRKLNEFYSSYRARYLDRENNQYPLMDTDVLFFTHSSGRTLLKGIGITE